MVNSGWRFASSITFWFGANPPSACESTASLTPARRASVQTPETKAEKLVEAARAGTEGPAAARGREASTNRRVIMPKICHNRRCGSNRVDASGLRLTEQCENHRLLATLLQISLTPTLWF